MDTGFSTQVTDHHHRRRHTSRNQECFLWLWTYKLGTVPCLHKLLGESSRWEENGEESSPPCAFLHKPSQQNTTPCLPVPVTTPSWSCLCMWGVFSHHSWLHPLYITTASHHRLCASCWVWGGGAPLPPLPSYFLQREKLILEVFSFLISFLWKVGSLMGHNWQANPVFFNLFGFLQYIEFHINPSCPSACTHILSL